VVAWALGRIVVGISVDVAGSLAFSCRVRADAISRRPLPDLRRRASSVSLETSLRQGLHGGLGSQLHPISFALVGEPISARTPDSVTTAPLRRAFFCASLRFPTNLSRPRLPASVLRELFAPILESIGRRSRTANCCRRRKMPKAELSSDALSAGFAGP